MKRGKCRRIFSAFLLFTVLIFILIIVMQTKTADTGQKYETTIPKEYIPIYQAAAKKYHISWYLLAAIHRVETKFSTTEPMISKAGALGPMQFMPCSFVGWKEKSCPLTNGLGSMSERDMTDPAYIKKHGGYGVDANHDGKADPWDLEDAVFSTANFLADNGATINKESQAIYAYNHSKKYLQAVLSFKTKYQKEWQNHE